MRRGPSALALLCGLGLHAPAAAQDGTSAAGTVARGDGRRWTLTADGREWSARPAIPTTLGDTGLFRLSTAYTLPRGAFSFSLFRDNVDRDPAGTDFSVHGLALGYGVAERLELFGNIGIQNRAKAHYLSEVGGPNEYPFVDRSWQTGFGDLHVGLKYGVLDDHAGGGALGLAVRAFVKLPTADERVGLGTGKTSFGADLVVSKTLFGADVHASVGYEWNGEPDTPSGFVPADRVASAWRWGVGLALPADRVFQLQLELTGKAYGDAALEPTDTADLVAGPAVWFGSGWFVRPALSYALGYDGRERDVSAGRRTGVQVAIGYHGGTRGGEVYAPPPTPPPPNRPPTVSVTCEPTPVLPGQVSRCRAAASDPDGDPLSHAWASEGGRVQGTTRDATLDPAGTPPGECVRVTVRVSDGRGGTAEATTRACVKEPE